MTVEEIRAKMEKLNVFIQDAEITVRGGAMADLAGLDKDVSLICTKAVSLPPEDARSVQPLMATLIRNLEQLSLALVEYKNDLQT